MQKKKKALRKHLVTNLVYSYSYSVHRNRQQNVETVDIYNALPHSFEVLDKLHVCTPLVNL